MIFAGAFSGKGGKGFLQKVKIFGGGGWFEAFSGVKLM
jgi:hypothetical protein